MFRRLSLPSLIALAAVPAAAQDGATVGPPVLRDFELPGTRETPPAEPQAVPDTEPAPRPEAEARPARPAPQPQPQPQPQSRVQPRAPQSQPAPSIPAAEPSGNAPAPAPLPDPPATAAPAPEATAPPVETGTRPFQLGWAAAAGGAVLILLLAARLLRRRKREADQDAPVEAAPAPPPPPPAVPVSPPVRAPELEVVFRAERMVATDRDITLHFALRVKNLGSVEVRDMAIDGRLFSAGPEQTRDLAAFLKEPVGEGAAAVPFTLEPGRGVEFASAVFMPKAEVREIMLEGRPLFVPTVALKIGYGFAGGRKVARGTYLVGIEPRNPAQKMGAFRLDLGPRVYRSVGQREIEVA